MKTKSEIEVEISCIENEIVQLSKLKPLLATKEWLESMNSAIRALKWVIDSELDSVDYEKKNHDYYGRFGGPS